MRRTSYLILAILVVAALNVAAVAAKFHGERVDATLVFPRSHSDRLLWPNDRSWTWSIRSGRAEAPSAESKLTLLMRRKRETAAETAAAISRPRILRDGEVTQSISLLQSAEFPPPSTLLAAIQVIDLTELLGESAEQPLCLRIVLSADTSRAWTLGPETRVPGRFLGCHHHAQPRWNDDELHLLNVFIRTEHGVDTYDLVLVRS